MKRFYVLFMAGVVLGITFIFVLMHASQGMGEAMKVSVQKPSIEATHPNLGAVCGKNFKWKDPVIRSWRDKPEGKSETNPSDKRYTMVLSVPKSISNVQLSICPIPSEPNRCWDQNLKNLSSGIAKFDIYLNERNYDKNRFVIKENKRILCEFWID
jgi:hypothetical protein